MVSIIVPVYNTEKYLDKCIQSILNQTYTDLEIIFINDGSTDRSLQILENYQEQDNRIQIISVENGGQGRARNIGIRQSKGKYIMFVDSDDWISERCVETLYNVLVNGQCDIVIGDCAKMAYKKDDSIQKTSRYGVDFLIDKRNKRNQIFKLPVTPWAKLVRKSLFTQFDIRFPHHYFEDASTIPLLYVVADKICYQREIVYYYRNREGSTVNSLDFIYDRLKYIPALEKELKRLGMYEEYKEPLMDYAIRESRINRRIYRELLTRKFQEYEHAQNKFDYEHFGVIGYEKREGLCVYGSYNLMAASKKFLRIPMRENIQDYYGFQNIISSTCEKNEALSECHISSPNPFRENLLFQDFRKTLIHRDVSHFKETQYFVLDFLEERHDTGCIDDEYFTLSDAFKEIEAGLGMTYVTLRSFEREWEKIWPEKCDAFIQYLKSFMKEEKIMLVKMKLAEKYVDDYTEHFFPQVERIRAINGGLERCYAYFIKRCPNALVVEVEHLESYHADKNFRHGCFPWHLNDRAYEMIALEMGKKVDYQKYGDQFS